jgi:dTDP-4-dehydrorhamnose 3,5-epimerase-like enzyme
MINSSIATGTSIKIGKFLVPNVLYPRDNPELVRRVELRKLPVYHDNRGCLIELVKEVSTETMCYISKTNMGMARDENVWHRHKLQEDRFAFLSGICIFAVSDGYTTQRIYITSEDNVQLIIPATIYHAFLSCSHDFMIINHPTRLYNPHDELRIPFEKVNSEAPWIIQSI